MHLPYISEHKTPKTKMSKDTFQKSYNLCKVNGVNMRKINVSILFKEYAPVTVVYTIFSCQ